MKKNNYNLKIGWLYPELMSTYGDRGNIIVLKKRCEWRDIKMSVLNLNEGFNTKLLKNIDIFFMGGAQDTQQAIVSNDFTGEKTSFFKKEIEEGKPGLFVCGAYQFLGKYYRKSDGSKIRGLGIFDLYTEHPGEGEERLIGNIAIKTQNWNTLVGFENHGGRTFIGNRTRPLGKVIKGYGNNEEDETEGAIYKNSIGTYLHGSVLPKNPEIADWLIEIALERKYKREIKLNKLDDSLSQKAKKIILDRII